jgi:hypothetical protein
MDGLEMNSNPDEVVDSLRDSPGRITPSPIGSSRLSRYETYSGMGSAFMSAPSIARISSSEGCDGIYMTANPCHVHAGESSRGVSGTEEKVDVELSCIGEEGSERDVKSTSFECRDSSDEEGLCGVGDTIELERLESVTYDVEGKALNFTGARSVDVSGHFRSCGGSTFCLEILRGCSIGLGCLRFVVDGAVVRVGECAKK